MYGLVTNVTMQAAARLAKKIKNGSLPDSFTVRDIYRRGWTLLDDRKIVEAACDELVSLGWLREYQPPTLTAGRPRLTEYAVNPRIRQ